jgi:hypothetical protein
VDFFSALKPILAENMEGPKLCFAVSEFVASRERDASTSAAPMTMTMTKLAAHANSLSVQSLRGKCSLSNLMMDAF